MRWCATELDWLRRLLLREPRGHPSMCGVLVLPPLDPGADVGIIVLEQGGFRPMSGSNTMCAVTALLETGRSEEHTSELQSRQYLVCRLLLEKKKKKMIKARNRLSMGQ